METKEKAALAGDGEDNIGINEQAKDTNKTDNQDNKTKESSDTADFSYPRNNQIINAVSYLKKKYDLRLNVISNTYEISGKGENKFSPLNEDALFVELQSKYIKVSVANITSIVRSDIVPQFNPISDYFKSLPEWNEKTDHIDFLASFIKAVDQTEFNHHFRKHLVRTVKCALDEGYYNKHAFIIRKDQQHDGKTEFIRFLCPPALKDYIIENINPHDKDSRFSLSRNLIVNLDELDGLGKLEVNQLKAFFSKDKINDRLPYGKVNVVVPRRASFFGSTNRGEFLNDETGSVRWLVFDILSIDFDYSNYVTGTKKVDINQVWAQAYSLYIQGFKCQLTKEEVEQNEKRNKKFQVLSMEIELIQKYFRPDPKKSPINFTTSSEMVISLMNLIQGYKPTTVRVGQALSYLKYERLSFYNEKNGQSRYGYFVIKTFSDLNPVTCLTRSSETLMESCPY